MMKLYDYWRSSAAHRVRIALNIKQLTAEHIPIDLVRDDGQQHAASYNRVNPQELVPALSVDGDVLTQSLAIIEYLEEKYPTPPLLPKDSIARAHVRAMALAIAADIHPLQNLRVRNYLAQRLNVSDEQTNAWLRHWIESGLIAVEQLVSRAPLRGRFCYGDAVTLADVVLVPQVNSARRFACDLTQIPRLVEIEEQLSSRPDFIAAAPDRAAVALSAARAAGGAQ